MVSIAEEEGMSGWSDLQVAGVPVATRLPACDGGEP
jgi:hypothetical protein